MNLPCHIAVLSVEPSINTDVILLSEQIHRNKLQL